MYICISDVKKILIYSCFFSISHQIIIFPGTFHSATGGTFETVLGGTINLLPSNQVVPLEYAILCDIFLNLLFDSGLGFVFGHHFRIHAKSECLPCLPSIHRLELDSCNLDLHFCTVFFIVPILCDV